MRSVGHLTTYGPIDSPTFATPFLSPLANRLEELDTNETKNQLPYIAIAVPPRVIPTITLKPLLINFNYLL